MESLLSELKNVIGEMLSEVGAKATEIIVDKTTNLVEHGADKVHSFIRKHVAAYRGKKGSRPTVSSSLSQRLTTVLGRLNAHASNQTPRSPQHKNQNNVRGSGAVSTRARPVSRGSGRTRLSIAPAPRVLLSCPRTASAPSSASSSSRSSPVSGSRPQDLHFHYGLLTDRPPAVASPTAAWTKSASGEMLPPARFGAHGVPLSYASGFNSTPPHVRARPGGGLLISHEESVEEVTGSTAFTNTQLVLNPGNPALFPVTFPLARMFLNYKMVSLQFLYKTGAPATEPGNVGLYSTPDNAPPQLTYTRATDMTNAKTCVIYKEQMPYSVPSTIIHRVAGAAPLLVRGSTEVPTSAADYDPDYDCGVATLFTKGQDAMDGVIVGQLFVKYEYEVFNFDTGDSNPIFNGSTFIRRQGTDIKSNPLSGGTYTVESSSGGLIENDQVTIYDATTLEFAIPSDKAVGYMILVKAVGTVLQDGGLPTLDSVLLANSDGDLLLQSADLGTADRGMYGTPTATSDLMARYITGSTSDRGFYGRFQIYGLNLSTTVTKVYVYILPFQNILYDYHYGLGNFGRSGPEDGGKLIMTPRPGSRRIGTFDECSGTPFAVPVPSKSPAPAPLLHYTSEDELYASSRPKATTVTPTPLTPLTPAAAPLAPVNHSLSHSSAPALSGLRTSRPAAH
jgi:hypothetical protein